MKKKLDDEEKLIKLLGNIIYMARRYCEDRKSYAVCMFNDTYDELRDMFGENIDPKVDDTVKNWPYATDGSFEKDSPLFGSHLGRKYEVKKV